MHAIDRSRVVDVMQQASVDDKQTDTNSTDLDLTSKLCTDLFTFHRILRYSALVTSSVDNTNQQT